MKKPIDTPKICKASMTKVQPWKISMPGKIPNGLQSLHFDILTLSPTKVIRSKGGQGASNLIQRPHNVGIIH
jgi:hypothetical protein